MIDSVEEPVQDDRQKKRRDDIRNHHRLQVAGEMKPAAQKKPGEIDDKVEEGVAAAGQQQGHLDVLIEVDFAEASAEITAEHVEQRVKTEEAAVADVIKKTAGEAGQKPFRPPLHEADGDRQDQHQVRLRGEKFHSSKYRGLQQKEEPWRTV